MAEVQVVVAAGANTAEHCVKVSNWKIGGGECERPLQVHFGAGAAEEEDPALDITPASLTSPAAERGGWGVTWLWLQLCEFYIFTRPEQ